MAIFMFAIVVASLLAVVMLFGFFLFLAFVAIAAIPAVAMLAAAVHREMLFGNLANLQRSLFRSCSSGISKCLSTSKKGACEGEEKSQKKMLLHG